MLRRFRRDQRGMAALEFALLAPVMVTLYCGVAELTLGMMAERRASHAAAVVGDLVAQSTTLSSAQVTDIFRVGDAILQPFPTSPLFLRITSVTVNAQGVAKVDWSQGHGMTAKTAGATVSGLPANLLAAGDSVIMTEVQYSYDSPLKHVMPNAVSLDDTFYLRPRKSPQVALTG